MSSIKPLDQQSIHKLCSSQVVVTLAIAVKELIENSVDSGATQIEIRFTNYGSDNIEVVDNGSGIREDDFEKLGKSHSTSKIQDFNDIYKIGSFGFRGEALFSLCQLADVTIHTKSDDSKIGTQIAFSNTGAIKSRRPLARARGTTVSLGKLFHTLPVRRRHLTDSRRLAKEFSQALTLISSYCLILTGVQISCYKIDKKCSKTLILSNMGGKSISSNIAAVYDQAQLNSMVEISNDFSVPDELIKEYNVKLSSEELDEIKISGYISAPPKVGGGLVGRSSSDRQFVSVNGRPCDLPQLTRLATDLWRRCCRETLLSSSQALAMPLRSTTAAFPALLLLIELPRGKVDVNMSPDKRQVLLHWERAVSMKLRAALTAALEGAGAAASEQSFVASLCSNSKATARQSLISTHLSPPPSIRPEASTPTTSTTSSQEHLLSPAEEGSDAPSPRAASSQAEFSVKKSEAKKARLLTPQPSRTPVLAHKPIFATESARANYETRLPQLNRESVKVDFSMGRLLRQWASIGSSKGPEEVPDSEEFHLKLTEPDAEAELTTVFRKEWFKGMQVIGQFNKGFIISQYGDNLFIVDQHASDEKLRFENLCANHQCTTQPLVVPQQLHLNSAQEHLLEEHMDVFTKSGFVFACDADAPLGQRFRLTSAPMSEGKIFNHKDVEEMIFVLSQGLIRNCRPSRLRDILASRACRSAVMVGTALDHKQMRRIVAKMSEMEHPWNCPHGRPTMRHLFNLRRLRKLE